MKKVVLLSLIILFSLMTSQACPLVREVHIKNGQDGMVEKDKKTNTEKKAERKAKREMRKNSVSERSKTQFLEDFGAKKYVVWKHVGEYDQAVFNDNNGKRIKAIYDYKGELVGTIAHKKFSDLPIKAQEKINEEYKDYSVADVIFFDEDDNDDSDVILYRLDRENDDYYVELIKSDQKIVVQLSPGGSVSKLKR